MTSHGVARKMALAFVLGMAVVAGYGLGARPEAADDNPVAGLKDARIAFDISRPRSTPT